MCGKTDFKETETGKTEVIKAEIKEAEPEKEQTKFRSAIVLAGGRGRRMGTVEKALLEFEGKTILERLLESLFRVVDEVILSVRDKIRKKNSDMCLRNSLLVKSVSVLILWKMPAHLKASGRGCSNQGQNTL